MTWCPTFRMTPLNGHWMRNGPSISPKPSMSKKCLERMRPKRSWKNWKDSLDGSLDGSSDWAWKSDCSSWTWNSNWSSAWWMKETWIQDERLYALKSSSLPIVHIICRAGYSMTVPNWGYQTKSKVTTKTMVMHTVNGRNPAPPGMYKAL